LRIEGCDDAMTQLR